MFLGWIGQSFCSKRLECPDYAETGVARFDDIVDVAVLGSVVGVGEFLFVFGFLGCYECGLFCRIFYFGDFTGEENLYCTAGTSPSHSKLWKSG